MFMDELEALDARMRGLRKRSGPFKAESIPLATDEGIVMEEELPDEKPSYTGETNARRIAIRRRKEAVNAWLA